MDFYSMNLQIQKTLEIIQYKGMIQYKKYLA